MRIQIFTTDGARCDTASVITLVNALQYFFVVNKEVVKIAFPERLLAEPLIQPVNVTRFVRDEVIGVTGSAADLNILVTSRLLPITDNRSTFLDNDIAIVSNHLWRARDLPETFRFARHILQLGMSRLLNHSSKVKSCIGGPQEQFDCLCQDCEGQLVGIGFRDGVIRLKESFNTLNQLQAGATDEILRDTSDLLTGELRLARDYVSDYQRNGVTIKDHIVLIVLHFLSDLVPFVKALNGLGANYTDIYLVAKPYPYARRDEVTHILNALGVNVERALKGRSVEACAHAVLTGLSARALSSEQRLLIIEDGG